MSWCLIRGQMGSADLPVTTHRCMHEWTLVIWCLPGQSGQTGMRFIFCVINVLHNHTFCQDITLQQCWCVMLLCWKILMLSPWFLSGGNDVFTELAHGKVEQWGSGTALSWSIQTEVHVCWCSGSLECQNIVLSENIHFLYSVCTGLSSSFTVYILQIYNVLIIHQFQNFTFS